ncbi:MAG: hypothetical protein E4H17_03610, partial [Gemmatimonadales bacterium]
SLNPPHRPSRCARCFLLAIATTACLLTNGCGDATEPPGPGTVSKVTVTPSTASVQSGGTAQLTAKALNVRNEPVSGVTFAWSTADPIVATVSSSGLVTGGATGLTTISATGGGKSDGAIVTVTGFPPSSAVLIAAGDIAQCNSVNDEATALLLDALPGTVAALGDNAYEDGSIIEYTDCYGPSWGRHKGRTKPSVGNHEYQTPGAAGYWAYWGAAAGAQGKGYYSYDLGAWHIVVLNSNCSKVSCAAGSTQEQWLRADLAASLNMCTLAYWHHPRFNSGTSHGNNSAVQPLWQALYDAGAEVILNGHEHLYERFGPQTPTGAADAAGGIRQFTVGTGGRALSSMGAAKPNSEVRQDGVHGVLELRLGVSGYEWKFVPVAGQTFTDAGTGYCH